MRRKKIVAIISVVVLIAAGLTVRNVIREPRGTIAFETTKPVRSDIGNTVTATGKLEALVTVEVGTQVSGIIDRIYVDFNSIVKRGEVIAEIDKTPLLAQLAQSQASLDDSEAELEYQTASYNRIKALYEKQLVAQADYDQAKYTMNRATASLANARSVHSRNQINLDYATISSPINGVVLDRVVDEGQTVAAGFTTPTLFTIANDLTQMQVEASIDEADIGKVRSGQRVEFTVDAYPDLIFLGTVTEVRLMPVIVSNVVTYTVIIDAPNPQQKLMPGMTASTVIYVEESSNALVIPARALQFTPDPDLMPDFYGSLSAETSGVGMSVADGRAIVWIKEEGEIMPVEIETGVNTGIEVEVLKGVDEHNEVVLSMRYESGGQQQVTQNNTRSPFMPGPPPGR